MKKPARGGDSTHEITLDYSSVSVPSVNSYKKDGSTLKSRKYKTLILKPIQENEEQDSVSIWAYKCVFQRCSDDLKFMKIGESSVGNFLKSPEVLEEVLY